MCMYARHLQTFRYIIDSLFLLTIELECYDIQKKCSLLSLEPTDKGKLLFFIPLYKHFLVAHLHCAGLLTFVTVHLRFLASATLDVSLFFDIRILITPLASSNSSYVSIINHQRNASPRHYRQVCSKWQLWMLVNLCVYNQSLTRYKCTTG